MCPKCRRLSAKPHGVTSANTLTVTHTSVHFRPSTAFLAILGAVARYYVFRAFCLHLCRSGRLAEYLVTAAVAVWRDEMKGTVKRPTRHI